jgi:hypothetical protein
MHPGRAHHKNSLRRIEEGNAAPNRRNPQPVGPGTSGIRIHTPRFYSDAWRTNKNAVNKHLRAATGLARQPPILHTSDMLNSIERIFVVCALALSAAATSQDTTAPKYTSDGQMFLPEDYREWVYLSSGFDMSYNPGLQMQGHHMFDNVFVNPSAYKAFVRTGTWPEKTMLVLEARGAEGKGSINQKGSYQGTERMGLEIHVKDTARFPGGWAFFGFDDKTRAAMVPLDASCYKCHSDHAAVDTTFVQFYPTLLPIAKSKGTLSSGYQKESAAASQ